jgi:hypothetical protein
MALSAGTRLGPYEILSPLDAGGMGEVYALETLGSIAQWRSKSYLRRLACMHGPTLGAISVHGVYRG